MTRADREQRANAMDRPTKLGNKKQQEDGYTFDSKAELRRYRELKQLQQAGQIAGLIVHGPTYELQPAFRDREGTHHRAITYTPDFTYVEHGIPVSEDVKGFATAEWRIKEKLCRFVYPDLDLRIIKV